ncbi:hypothetical protein [Sandarakinorhabdus sp.]|uniref:hypothetical protein n=1 Tax=Sandarakinorhabdus sp. TaxID=1916663 RepID=UPI00286E5BF4|nr:hypothetical protein [Sandarakinorhabdus sp.]
MRLKAATLAFFITISTPIFAQPITRSISPEIGTIIDVTPGQVFYSDTYIRSVEAYEIDRPFKSSMAGSMGFRFSFSIDSITLLKKGVSRDGIWSIYVPEKFSASHGLLGNVLSPGDTVGLLVSKTGEMQWFVDNSIRNNTNTIWSRKLNPKDPQPKLISTQSSETVGLPLFRLVFLGVQNANVRIRFEQRDETGTYVRDEFTYPIRNNSLAVGAVRGAEFIVKVGDLQSQIFVTKPMTGEFGLFAPKPIATPPPEIFKL